MARRDDNLQARLERDLTELKLAEIARSNNNARRNSRS